MGNKALQTVALTIVANAVLPGAGSLVGSIVQGAAVGAGVSAVTGGDIGKGALYGGVTGGIGYGANEYLGGAGEAVGGGSFDYNAAGEMVPSNYDATITGAGEVAAATGTPGLAEGASLSDLGTTTSELAPDTTGTLSELQTPTAATPTETPAFGLNADQSTSPFGEFSATPDRGSLSTFEPTPTDFTTGTESVSPYEAGGSAMNDVPVYDYSRSYTPEDMSMYDRFTGTMKDLGSYMPSMGGGKGGIGSTMMGLGNLYSAYTGGQQAKYLRGISNEMMGNQRQYQNLLQSTYTNPEMYLNTPEFKALNDMYLNELKRKDAAAGRVSQYGARANLAQKTALANLGNYRQGLTGAVNASSPASAMNLAGTSAAMSGYTNPALVGMGLSRLYG